MGTCMFVDYIHVHVEDFRDYVLQTNLSVFCSWGLWISNKCYSYEYMYVC